jgi:hypothetical protein
MRVLQFASKHIEDRDRGCGESYSPKASSGLGAGGREAVASTKTANPNAVRRCQRCMASIVLPFRCRSECISPWVATDPQSQKRG